MSDTLQYIDTYFSGRMSTAEKEAFERECESDPLFAEEVAFYISARDHLKQELHEQKKKEFDELYTQFRHQKPSSKVIMRKIVAYAAAASLLIILGWQLFFKAPSAQKIASRYIENRFDSLSITMSAGPTDSLQLGLEAFNQKNYSRAEEIFQRLMVKRVNDPEVVKNLGIVYLVRNEYDKAIEQFETLSDLPLAINYGPFYKALTLMKRSAQGDREEAKNLLEEVKEKGLAGRAEAERWLKNM